MPWLLLMLGAGATAWLVSRAFRPAQASLPPPRFPGMPPPSPTYGRAAPKALGYATATWIPPLSVYAAMANVPLPFALAWIEEESGGNPCAIGRADQKGPDGFPREMGIAQLYNPTDLRELRLSSSALRAYCSIDPNDLERVIRPLTPAEISVQAKAAIDMVVKSRTAAEHALMAAGATWRSDSRDFWRLVKLVHGLPGLVNGLSAVAKHLGRPPASWSEFRKAIEHDVKLDVVTESYRNNPPKRINFSDIFDNAEKAAAGIQSKAVA